MQTSPGQYQAMPAQPAMAPPVVNQPMMAQPYYQPPNGQPMYQQPIYQQPVVMPVGGYAPGYVPPRRNNKCALIASIAFFIIIFIFGGIIPIVVGALK